MGEPVEWLSEDLLQDVRGTVDIHYHPDPDFCRRLETDIQLARRSKAAGMQAIVLKGHVNTTYDRAQLAREAVPGAAVFGGIVLNSPLGGLNVEAVDICLRRGGKIVWGPTMWAQNHIDYIRGKSMDGYQALGMRFPEIGVTVLDEKRQLKREAIEICRLIARHDACLATGHLSLEEQDRLIDVALDLGVKRIVINHPNYQVTPIPIKDQMRLAAKGCFLEYCYMALTPQWQVLDPVHGWSPRRVAQSIKQIGAEHCIIATDCGQLHNPPQVEAMRQMIQMMKEEGLDDREIDLVARRNPGFVIGL